jgi:glutathione S-transferase
MKEDLPVLWHLKPSHFNEKVRWALDYKGVPHQRIHATPGAHMLTALALTRRSVTMPVLWLDGRTIGDSTRIIAALEARFPDPPLYPSADGERARALELEEMLDAGLGPDARRAAFWAAMQDGVFFTSPLAKALARARFGIGAKSATESLARVRETMHLLGGLLEGGDHLVGERFSVADLTAAALLAPLIGPPGLPYRPRNVALPPHLDVLSSELRAMPAGRWAIRTYERFRPPSFAVNERSQSNTAASTASFARRE